MLATRWSEVHSRRTRGSSRRRHVLAAAVGALTLTACATPRDASGPEPAAGAAAVQPTRTASQVAPPRIADSATSTTAVPGASATSTDGADVRHGDLDGRGWTLVTTRRGTSLCLRLGWDDVEERWEVCYSDEYADLPLAWTNPTPPPGTRRQVMFVVGLAPRTTASVEVLRGDVVVGRADAFAGDVVPDRAGFALPLAIEGRDTMGPTVDLPGDGLRAGLLLPLEIVARDAGGSALARGAPTIGGPGPLVCLDTGAAVVEFDGACITPADPWTVETNDGRMLLVPAPDDTHHVELVLDGVVVDTHPTARLRLPARYGGTTLTLAAFRLTAEQAWNPFVVESRDADGTLLASMPMFRGGEGEGEGVIPDTL